MSHSPLRSLWSLVLLALLLVVTGCGRISFVSERYDNFTAYYNTFYNAEKSYTEGIEALETTDERIERRFFIPVFEMPGQTINDQKFQAAIDKSADVLRDHPDSKWVDDALVLIGKSYFYQQNFVGAEQKFREVIDLATPLQDEARLWLARTLIAAGAYDEALDHLIVTLAREDLSDRWRPSLHLALGELYVKREDFDTAAEQLETGLEDVRDNRREARAAFLLGQVYEKLGEYEKAVEAYQRVERAHPRYELSYAAKYSAVRVQGLYVDPDEALRALRRMEHDDKNYSNRYELAYLRGRIYQSDGYAGDARAQYHEILYDSEGQISDIRGRVHYALGELYRDAYHDFELASAHFDTARTAVTPPTQGGQGRRASEITYAPEAITDATELSDMFGSFANVRAQIAEMDSLLHLGSMSDEEFTAKILEIRKQMAEELAEEQRRAERLQAERGFQNAGVSQRGSQTTNAATASGTAGFLFHQDPIRVQEGRMNFISRWGERPLAPNWRRIEAIENVAASADSAGVRPGQVLTELDPGVGQNPLPPLDYSDVPRDSLSRAALRAKRALARYELANVLFLSMDRPDSAATWYRTVIDEDAEFPVAQRAFYALAEVHSSLGDSSAARRLYEQVLRDYPESDFAGRVRERLGIRIDVPSDTLALAEDDYRKAYQRWQRGSYETALNDMVEVAAAYPRLEVAPRSLLAAGRIYMEWADRDSLDLFAPLPIHVPDSVLDRAGLLDLPESVFPAARGQAPPGGQPGAKQGVNPDAGEIAPGSNVNVPQKGPPGQAPPNGQVPQKRAPGQKPATGQGNDAAGIPPKGGAGVEKPQLMDGAPEIMTPDNAPNQRARLLDEEPVRPSEADSAAVADTTAPLTDSTAVLPDSTVALTDSTAVLPDTAADERLVDPVVVDSADVAPQDAAQVVDSTAFAGLGTPIVEEEEAKVYLKTLYSGVKQRYPNTAYSDQADIVLNVLKEREEEIQATTDSIAAAQADSIAALSASTDSLAADASGLETDSLGVAADSLGAAADSLGLNAASDSLPEDSLGTRADSVVAGADDALDDPEAAEVRGDGPTLDGGDTPDVDDTPDAVDAGAVEAAADSTRQPPTPSHPADTVQTTEGGIPTGEAAIRGEGGINRELGGYTLVIGMADKEAPMRTLAEKYRAKGFRTDVIVENTPDGPVYRAAVGHFASQREAGILLQAHLNQFEETVQLAALSDFE